MFVKYIIYIEHEVMNYIGYYMHIQSTDYSRACVQSEKSNFGTIEGINVANNTFVYCIVLKFNIVPLMMHPKESEVFNSRIHKLCVGLLYVLYKCNYYTCMGVFREL